MKIELDLDHLGQHNARLLRSWASIGRLFDSATRQLGECYEKLENTATSDELNDIQTAIEDLKQMKEPLDTLHHCVRQQLVAAGVKPLWDQNQK